MIILLACLPKTGSTFVSHLIARLPNFVAAGFVPDGERREQEIDMEMAVRYVDRNCIAQHHVRASQWTINCIHRFEMRPIVLVRNLYDAIVSLSDHIVRESPVMPFAYFDASFIEMEPARRIESIVDLAVPWYFNFYVSWWHYRPDLIVTYEDIVLGGASGIRRFVDKVGLQVSDDEIEGLLQTHDKTCDRYNVGIAGRGEAILSGKCKDAIDHLANHYPLVDFSPLGLRSR